MIGNREKLPEKRIVARICTGCGEPFDAVRPPQAYCRPSCRARHEHAQAQQSPRLPFDDLDARLFDVPFE